MGGEQCGNHGSRPASSGSADRFERLDFVLDGQAVARLGFDRRRSVGKHGLEGIQDSSAQLGPRSLAHADKAGANAAPGSQNLLVCSAADAFFKIHEARVGENRMSMTIDEPWEDYTSAAVDLFHLALVSSQPGMTEDFPLCGCGDNLASPAKHGGALDQSDFPEDRTAAWPRTAA